MRSLVFISVAAVLVQGYAFAGPSLEPGAYRIDVHLEIPNVETGDYDFTHEMCITPETTARLGPLGPGPLATCPRTVRPTSSGIQISVRCEGPNTAYAIGDYRPTNSGFRGTVHLNMGGKNMTLVEHQRGTRLGACVP